MIKATLKATILVLGLHSIGAFGANYYACGTDEDGCNPQNPGSCICMPQDKPPKSKGKYCLDLSDVSCRPYQQGMSCTKIFASNAKPTPQAACLKLAYESDPFAPNCQIRPKAWCQQHNIAICQRDGGQRTCR